MEKISRKGFLKVAAAAAMSGVTAGALAACNSAASSSTAATGDAIYTAGTYTGTATSSYVKGYTVTADYTGTVSRIALNKVRYVAIFEGTPLEPVQPVEEGATPAQFNWLAIAVPFGIVALVGAGTGAALFMKRRHETSEEDTE